jgi:hypothetical protein
VFASFSKNQFFQKSVQVAVFQKLVFQKLAAGFQKTEKRRRTCFSVFASSFCSTLISVIEQRASPLLTLESGSSAKDTRAAF